MKEDASVEGLVNTNIYMLIGGAGLLLSVVLFRNNN